jgi:hypothetical protein
LTDPNTRRASSALALFLACLALASCGGPNVKAEIPNGVSLEGKWRLDRAVSDDPQALLLALNQKFAKREMHRAGFDPDDPFAPGPGEAPGGNRADTERHRAWGPANYLRARYGAALAERLGADGMTIEQSPDRFVIVRGESRRSYIPGGHSVVSVEDGVADQTSGWKGREYLIDVKPQVGPHLTERFGLTADGRLIEKVSLSEAGLPDLEFTRMYERGEAPTRSLPTSN